jgi:hypothetical protein
MSSWGREMAKKPPAKVEFTPLVSAPEQINSSDPPPLMRTFESPIAPRNRDQARAENRFIMEPLPVVESKPGVELMRSFENNSRFNKRENTTQKRTPEPWVPLDKVLKQMEQRTSPNVKQLPRPSNPQVTVLIDIKNDITFLDAFLQSLSRQSYSDWVVLIGLRNDDSSTKSKISDIVTRLQLDNIANINNIPESLSEHESYMINASTINTPYIALARHTDLWVSKKLEKQLEELKNEPELGLVGTMSRLFGDKVELVNIPPGRLNISDFDKTNPLVFSSVLLKRDLLNFTSGFKSYDFESWLRMSKEGIKMSNLNSILTLQRINGQVAPRPEDRDDVRKKYLV